MGEGIMTESVNCELLQRVSRLERSCAGLRLAVTALVLLLIANVVGIPGLRGEAAVAQKPGPDDVLIVRGLVVVDGNGRERVRLGAPLPDPVVNGKRLPRKAAVSGVLIFDADGDERGGYVTSDKEGNAFLTLDAKTGQQALFLANRDGGAHLTVWSGADRNSNYASIRAVPTPFVELVRGGKSIYRAGIADAFAK